MTEPAHLKVSENAPPVVVGRSVTDSTSVFTDDALEVPIPQSLLFVLDILDTNNPDALEVRWIPVEPVTERDDSGGLTRELTKESEDPNVRTSRWSFDTQFRDAGCWRVDASICDGQHTDTELRDCMGEAFHVRSFWYICVTDDVVQSCSLADCP